MGTLRRLLPLVQALLAVNFHPRSLRAGRIQHCPKSASSLAAQMFGTTTKLRPRNPKRISFPFSLFYYMWFWKYRFPSQPHHCFLNPRASNTIYVYIHFHHKSKKTKSSKKARSSSIDWLPDSAPDYLQVCNCFLCPLTQAASLPLKKDLLMRFQCHWALNISFRL